jgi:hypothetical protein
MQRGFWAFLIVAAAGLLGLASGCGGGDEGNGSTTRTVAGHTITVPTVTTPNTGSTGTESTASVPSTITLPSGQRIQTSDLTPFRDCLRRHGVEPLPLDRGQSGFGELTPERVAQLRAQIQARLACAPQLPPPLRSALERYRRQLQERRQGK